MKDESQTPNWLKQAEQSGLTEQDALRESKKAELEDSGAALIAQFKRMRERFMRLLREQDEGW